MNYQNMTNPEIVAAIANLEGEEREKALASLGKKQREAVDEALAAQIPPDGARAAVLERLGREKQIADSQAWTSDGVSPNSALVTAASAGKFVEHPDPEAVIDQLATDTAAKAEASGDIVAGKDTSVTLSSEEAAGEGEGKDTVKASPSMKRDELDAIASDLGLDPASYSNKEEIIAAIEEAQRGGE
jgi:hypothetical protein